VKRPSLIIAAGLVIVVAAILLAIRFDRAEIAGDGRQAGKPTAAERQAVVEPSFDIVRINPAGDAVIAGRATPKAEVVLLDNGKEFGRVIADQRGEWVYVPDQPMPPGTRELTLRATNPDGSTGQSVGPVVLVVPSREDGAGPALAVKVTPSGPVLLQGPAAKEGAGELVIALANTDSTGKLSLSGKARPGATVHLYLDNQFLGRTQAGPTGDWRFSAKLAENAKPHLLRADQVAADGKVSARVEIQFVGPGDIPTSGNFVVQPGHSLWRIARGTYGSGFEYIVIYQANRDQIRDPDLIYPGQVFSLPRR
jgi:nucleoid-associated protein YgaU